MFREKISYGMQYIDNADKKAVNNVLSSNNLTQGPIIEKFEKKLSAFFGSKYCCAVSSGTAALHLTALALGWGKKDIIISSPITFVAGANSVLYSNSIPDFCDIDKDSYNINPDEVEKKIKYYKKKRKKVKAVIATDFAGNPCDWRKLKSLSSKYGFKLINDNCHSFGSEYLNNKKYAIKYADVVIQSFHPVKMITTGEGGAIITNDIKFYKKISSLRSHGIEKNLRKKEPWYYELRNLGFNYRITDIQCALGLSQLKKINTFILKRKIIAKLYDNIFKNKRYLTIPKKVKNSSHAYHLYPLRINFRKLKIDRSYLFEKMKKLNVNLQVHYIPVHLQPVFRKNYYFKKGQFPQAEKFYEEEVSLPIHYSLNLTNVKKIAKMIINLCESKK